MTKTNWNSPFERLSHVAVKDAEEERDRLTRVIKTEEKGYDGFNMIQTPEVNQQMRNKISETQKELDLLEQYLAGLELLTTEIKNKKGN